MNDSNDSEEDTMFNFLKKDDNFKRIPVNDIDELLGKIKLIDIREKFELRGGTIRTAKHVPMNTLLVDPDKYMTKDEPYYLLCRSGARSGRAAKLLAKQGYQTVTVDGGFSAYHGKNKVK